MSRFVILEHDHPVLHWDFLLDDGAERIPTWRLASPPSVTPRDTAEKIDALRLPDHRRVYLDYEGPVSGDRGHVIRWEAGMYVLLHGGESELELRLEGARLHGFATLVRVQQDENEQWTFNWLPDEQDVT